MTLLPHHFLYLLYLKFHHSSSLGILLIWPSSLGFELQHSKELVSEVLEFRPGSRLSKHVRDQLLRRYVDQNNLASVD